MKKQIFQRILAVAVPLMAFVLSTTGDSVVMLNPATQETGYASYLSCGMLSPMLASLLALIAVVLGVCYSATEKKPLAGALAWVCFAGTFLATLPILYTSDIKVIPNVGVPILLGLQCLMSFYTRGKKEEAPSASRLDSRR